MKGLFHIHRYNLRVLPNGGEPGLAMLACMAATGKWPYRCYCGRVSLR